MIPSMFTRHSSSYRDPSGFLFYHNDVLYRQVSQSFKTDFDQFISGGLYQHLVGKKILIPHSMINENFTDSPDWYQTLQPEVIPFISYPYEWCFDMWKDAALGTLEAAKEAMDFGMMLKDASAYNLQWHNGKMTFIDTLSFEKYDDTKPWIAYRQFCEHFLAPLALMHYLKEPLPTLFVAYPDGIPLLVTKKLLPAKSKFHLHSYLHLHVQARMAQKKSKQQTTPTTTFSRKKLLNILMSLEAAVKSYSLNQRSGVWSEYYEEANQRADYVAQKKQIINDWISKPQLKTAIDVGANEGEFSKLLAEKNIYTISTDFDHYSINKLYQETKRTGNKNIHPLVIDISNPSPAIGMYNEERTSFLNRVKTDIVLALALIHHLAIGKNIPFEDVAKTFGKLGKALIIEFIPKEDEKVQLMLQQKKDIYDWYTLENFLSAFARTYKIVDSSEIGSSKRILYLMQPI